MADCVTGPFNGKVSTAQEYLERHGMSKPFLVPMWSTRLLDDRTQEQKDFADAMDIVNAIAPGWPLP